MKKLMIALAAVAMAIGAQAAAINWATPVLKAGDATGAFTDTNLSKATGISNFSVVLTFFDADGNPLTSVGNTSSSKFAKSGAVTAVTTGYDFLVNTDYKYSAHYEYKAGDVTYTMDVGPTTFTQDQSTGNYSLSVAQAGAWTVQGVLEPTSGLLLLLGVAGLALRRGRRC